MSKIAISGYYGFDNFGDEAILYVLVNHLKKDYHHVTVFSKMPDITSKKYGINSAQTFSLKEIYNVLKESDVLISGGGSLLQDVTGIGSLMYYLFVIWLAQFLKKKTIIFVQGMGPIRNLFLKFVTRKILSKADYISVRDKKSLSLLNEWGLEAKLTNDPVWGLDVVGGISSEDTIGIQLREWKNLSEEFLEKMADVVASNFPMKKVKLFAFQNSVDIPVCEKFKDYLKINNIHSDIIVNDSVEEVTKNLATCSLLIAMRYHALLLGIKMGIPSMAISYDIKVETLAKENGIPYCEINDILGFKNSILKVKTNEYRPINKSFSFEDIDAILEG